MKIKAFENQNNHAVTYVLTENGHAIVIDPGETSDFIYYIEKEELKVDYAFLTHEHIDHIANAAWVKRNGGVVVCSIPCRINVNDDTVNLKKYYSRFFKVLNWENQSFINWDEKEFHCPCDMSFDNLLCINWFEHGFTLKKTPGHTEGSICIVLDNSILFSGDSLINGYKINTGFPTGDKVAYEKITSPWIKSLAPNIIVYPGHFDSFELCKHKY